MNWRAIIISARLLSAARAISPNDRTPKVAPAALKQFQELLGCSEEQLNRFMQNPLKQKELLQMGEIAKNHILFEVIKKTL